MKVVIANKYWHLKGGADRYALELAELLEKHGDEAVPFAMQDPKNVSSTWGRHFVSPVQTAEVRFGWSGLKTAMRSLWSGEAARNFSALLDETSPDVVHLQNIYRQISPSIIPQAERRHVPIVMTAHDYALVAPQYSLYHDGAICEVTKPDDFWRAVGHRCVKRSRAASALVALEMSFHRMLGVWEGVDRIIAPSRFLAALLADYGVPEERIVHLPYAIDAATWTPRAGGGYALFVGRLSPEKGVDTLIRAAALLPDIPLRIVGTGPQEDELRKLAATIGAKNVAFVGFKAGQELKDEYAGARFVVIPSQWYEVFGLVALEAYAAGKPVVASQIGGLAEVVRDGETGLYASAGDHKDLAENMRALWLDENAAKQMGAAGRAWVEKDFTTEAHYQGLMDVYADARRSMRMRE